MKQGPLAIPLDPNLANYEDRIVIDEAKRKMDNMVNDARNKGVIVDTVFYNPEEQAAINKQAARYGITPNRIKGRWYSDSENEYVNVPRTPSLNNLNIMAEEMEHQFNRIKSPTNPMEAVDYRWREENRAKDEALRTSGGLFPRDLKNQQGTRKSYFEILQDNIAAEQMAYNQGKEMANRNIATDTILDLFWDSTASKKDRELYDYWSKENTTPIEYFSNKYPEVVYGPLAKR